VPSLACRCRRNVHRFGDSEEWPVGEPEGEDGSVIIGTECGEGLLQNELSTILGAAFDRLDACEEFAGDRTVLAFGDLEAFDDADFIDHRGLGHAEEECPELGLIDCLEFSVTNVAVESASDRREDVHRIEHPPDGNAQLAPHAPPDQIAVVDKECRRGIAVAGAHSGEKFGYGDGRERGHENPRVPKGRGVGSAFEHGRSPRDRVTHKKNFRDGSHGGREARLTGQRAFQVTREAAAYAAAVFLRPENDYVSQEQL